MTREESEALLARKRAKDGAGICVRVTVTAAAAGILFSTACSSSDESTLPAAAPSSSPLASTSAQAPPKPPIDHKHLMGCVCKPGDPLCSCL